MSVDFHCKISISTSWFSFMCLLLKCFSPIKIAIQMHMSHPVNDQSFGLADSFLLEQYIGRWKGKLFIMLSLGDRLPTFSLMLMLAAKKKLISGGADCQPRNQAWCHLFILNM